MDSEANIVSNLRVALKIQLCSSQERRHTLDVADFHLRQTELSRIMATAKLKFA